MGDYLQKRYDEGLMAVLRPCLPGLWTLVAKENGDAKTGIAWRHRVSES